MGSQGTSVSVSVGLGFRLSILSMKVKAKKKNHAVSLEFIKLENFNPFSSSQKNRKL